jgi:hypothetical protein
MKKIFLAFTVLALFTSCDSGGFSYDSSASMLDEIIKINEDGLRCSDVYLEINANKADRNTFEYAEEVYFYFNNVKGFKKENDKVYPGLSFELTEVNSGEVVLSYSDLFEENNGFEENSILLYTNIILAIPYKNGEKYRVNANMWDKKGDGKLDFEMPFMVVENESFEVQTTDVSYSAMYLWNGEENKLGLNDELDKDDKTTLFFEGVKGFKEINGLIYSSLSLSIKDSKGGVVVSKENLLSAYKESGIDAEEFNQIFIDLEFFEKKYSNPLQLKAILSDLNSDSELILETELIVN